MVNTASEKTRTLKQSKSLWLWCELLSETLTEAGLDMRKTLKPEIEIPWTKESVCDYLFRPIMKAMYGKTSTRDLTTKELTKVSETLMRHLGQKLNIQCDFPSIESLAEKEL